MTYKELVAKSNEIHRKNGLISHLIFLLLGLLAAAFSLLGIFSALLEILIVPFIILPILFAATFLSLYLREASYISFKGFLISFATYFSNKFRSTFGVLRSGAIGIIIFTVVTLIYFPALNLSLYQTNWMNMQGILGDLTSLSTLDVESMLLIIDAHKEFFDILTILNFIPPYFVFGFVFFVSSTKNSISLFDRLNTKEGVPGRFNYLVHQNVMRKFRGEYNKRFYGLNWPMFVIFIASFALGTFLGYLVKKDFSTIYSFGMALSLFACFGIYGPFFISNNEAIYESFSAQYIDEKGGVTEEIAKALEEALKQMEKEDEDTKKDSDES